MSIFAQTGTAGVRALALTSLVIAVATPLHGWLAGLRGRRQRVAWALLGAPFFTPALLTGYAWATAVLHLGTASIWRELTYDALLFVRLLPVAVLVRLLAPSQLTREAAFCHWLLGASFLQRAQFAASAAGRASLPAVALVALLAFSEFELAAMWGVKSWTVAIFDAQTGGLPLIETLQLVAPALLAELTMLMLLLLSVRRVTASGMSSSPLQSTSIWPWLGLGLGAAASTIAPLALVVWQAALGWPSVASNAALSREIIGSLGLAALAATASAATISALRRHRAALVLISVPGLLGALVLSLLLLAFFQRPIIRVLYDTSVPLLLGLLLLLLPLAALLSITLRVTQHAEGLHIARFLGSRELIWQLSTRRHFLAAFLLFCWAYFDFTAGSLLAPVTITPVFVRLHNLSHYGQTAVLSAMLCAALAAPALVLGLTGFAARLYARAHER